MKPSSKLKIIMTQDPEIISELGRLRYQVWTHEGLQFADKSVDQKRSWLGNLDYSDNCYHYAVLDPQGNVVAGSRMSIHNEKDSLPEADLFTAIGDKRVYFPLGSLGRTVVHPDYRGQGLQGQLLTAREDTAQEMGIMQMFAVATGLSNFSYYKSKGFRFLGSGPQYKDFKQNHHEYICIIKDLEQSQAQAL